MCLSTAECWHVFSPANEVLQHAALSGTLTTNDSNLWQIKCQRNAKVGETVLQFVDHRDQLFHACVTCVTCHSAQLTVEIFSTQKAAVFILLIRKPNTNGAVVLQQILSKLFMTSIIYVTEKTIKIIVTKLWRIPIQNTTPGKRKYLGRMRIRCVAVESWLAYAWFPPFRCNLPFCRCR